MDLKMEWPDEHDSAEYLLNDFTCHPHSWKERVYDDDLYFDEELSVLLQLPEIKPTWEGCY